MALNSKIEWTESTWNPITGCTKISEGCENCIEHIRNTPAKIKFISFEPLIGDVGVLNLDNINWAIVGGESGWHSRPIKEEWIVNIKTQCEEQGVLFYFKQWGGINKKKSGRVLFGRTWDDMPVVERI